MSCIKGTENQKQMMNMNTSSKSFTGRHTATINQTGGANGNVNIFNITPTYTSAGGSVRGFNYEPTVTSITGDHLSFRATAGNMLVPAASYINYGTTVGSSGRGVRDNAGVVEVKSSGGEWRPVGDVTTTNSYTSTRTLVGTSGATTFSETILTSSEISNGQSVRILCIVTGKQIGRAHV